MVNVGLSCIEPGTPKARGSPAVTTGKNGNPDGPKGQTRCRLTSSTRPMPVLAWVGASMITLSPALTVGISASGAASSASRMLARAKLRRMVRVWFTVVVFGFGCACWLLTVGRWAQT